MMADAGFRSMVVPLRADHVAAIRPTLLLIQAGALSCWRSARQSRRTCCSSGPADASGAGRAPRDRREPAGTLSARWWSRPILLALARRVARTRCGAAGDPPARPLGAEQLPLGRTSPSMPESRHSRLAGRVRRGHRAGDSDRVVQPARQCSQGAEPNRRGGTANRAAQRLRHGFIVAQIALAFVLLAGAGLLGLSLAGCSRCLPASTRRTS